MSIEKAIELASSFSNISLPSPSLPAGLSDTTIINNTVIQVTHINNSSPVRMIDELYCKMSERQQQVLDQLYETAKLATKELLSLSSMDDAMKIGKMIATIVKLVEKASYRGEKIPGAEKREIALALGKRLVADPTVIENDTVRGGVGMAYDILGESMLETLLDVSRHVNTAIQQAAVSCCESILACIKK